MKRILLVVWCVICSVHAIAQSTLSKEEEERITKAVSQRMELHKKSQKYLHLGFVSHTLSDDADLVSFKSKFGASLSSGRTFFLHRDPLAGMLKIGLDWTYIDLNYTTYKEPILEEDVDGNWIEDEVKVHAAEAGMHIGPSITVFPVNRLAVKAYFRYAPSYSAMYDTYNEEFSSGFGSYFVSGISANYGGIGLGIEQRWGSAKHRTLTTDLEDDDFGGASEQKEKFHLKGPRIFVAFSF
ncbi:hypothetical protein [Sphingobacterium suaedae]|uniref:Outer membrane protein beta-barrel domain-containing protein n=1 Tax=Sphingobacterium suaedae TaxID=1686402 RepID=A0ABW5KK69_9SPHI